MDYGYKISISGRHTPVSHLLTACGLTFNSAENSACEKPSLLLKKTCDNRFSYECENRHEFCVIDGVLDFGTREIPGEQWSLSYRNYEEYLHEHYWSRNPNYDRGLNEADIIWDKKSVIARFL